MRIGTIAQAAHMDVETIRHNEKARLLAAPLRRRNGSRDYGEQHAGSLAFIRHCRAPDIALADVGRPRNFAACAGTGHDDANRRIEVQMTRPHAPFDARHGGQRRRAGLRACCATGQVATDCGIRAGLVTSGHGEGGACQTSESQAPR